MCSVGETYWRVVLVLYFETFKIKITAWEGPTSLQTHIVHGLLDSNIYLCTKTAFICGADPLLSCFLDVS